MEKLSKLQIRAKVLSVLSEIKANREYTKEALDEYIKALSAIPDKQAMFDIFIKEFVKLEADECDFCSLLIKEIVDNNYIDDKVLEILKSSSYSDEAKYKLVQLLRIVGSKEDVVDLPNYFDNPAEMIDKETERLLEKAIFNPETMLDFLDFIYTVNDRDKEILLFSLRNDYKCDSLANILFPIVYSDFSDSLKLKVVEMLSESKSSIAIEPLNYLLSVTENEDIKTACSLGLKKLKLSGATEEKAKEYYANVLNGSKPAEFYTTIPDGAGNQALLISRMTEKNSMHFAAIVINDKLGIIDCFGFFDISESETIRIITKFYQSEGKYKVSAEYAKTRINQAIKQTIASKRNFPYEFICWSTLLKDVKELEILPEDVIDNVDIPSDIDKDQILTALTKEYSFRWYISKDDNTCMKSLIKDICDIEDLSDIKNVNEITRSYIDKIFTQEESTLWKNRIIQLIYLLYENDKSLDSAKFLYLIKNDEMFNLFKEIILQRSVVNNLVYIKENTKESLFATNIFRKKNLKTSEYDVNQIDKILKLLNRNWINE